MRRVLIVLPEMETGGGQKMAVAIANHISIQEIQIKILVLYPRQGSLLEQEADSYGLDIQYLKKKNGVDLSIIPQIHKVIRAFQPDVIHAHLRVMPYLLLPVCVSRTRRVFYTVHNIANEDAKGIARLTLFYAFRHCDVQPVAISPLCRRSIANLYRIPENKIPCINVAIDIGRFNKPCSYKHISDKIRFVAVGRLMAQKNYPLMLSAFHKLHQSHKNTELYIFGDGDQREQLAQQIIALNLADCVKLPGVTAHIEKELWKAQIYIMSSDYEGLPQTILEAMSAGLPVISTRAGGVVDVIEDGENGLLTNCGDLDGLVQAMKMLVESDEMRFRFSRRSLELVQQYNIEKCAREYLELYLK